MGMFDYLHCEIELEDDDEQLLFQTKDLKCALDTYFIAKDKTLRKIQVTDPNANDPLSIPSGLAYTFAEEIYMSLDMRFYTDNKDGVWREYEARFRCGKCVDIKLLKTQTIGGGI